MKNIVIFIFLSFLLSCSNLEKPQKVKTEVQSINTILDNWHKAAAEANYQNYFEVMDSISVFVGTDEAEVWSKQDFQSFSKPFFDKGKAWSFEAINRNIYQSKSGDIVWFDEVLDTWMGKCRGSGVLENTNGKWKLKHYVLSLIVPNDDMRDVVDMLKK